LNLTPAHEIPFASLLESVPQAICLVDGDSVVRFANSPGAAALGFGDPEELIGHVLSPEARSTHTWLAAHDPPGPDWTFLTVDGRDALHLAQRRVIGAADEARSQVSHDLHDGAQQDLVTVVINLQLALQKWEGDPEDARALVSSAVAHAKLGVQGLRQLVDGIHPLILTSRGLGAAVEAFAARLPLPVRLSELPEGRFDPGVEVALYFLVAEALTNSVKHASASLATVRFEQSPEQLVVEVGDDGVGGAELSGRTRGLTRLGDRIGALGGTLSVTSEVGAGTLVRASLPLRNQGPPTLM
jgi:signal transduction histidine kinase